MSRVRDVIHYLSGKRKFRKYASGLIWKLLEKCIVIQTLFSTQTVVYINNVIVRVRE